MAYTYTQIREVVLLNKKIPVSLPQIVVSVVTSVNHYVRIEVWVLKIMPIITQ